MPVLPWLRVCSHISKMDGGTPQAPANSSQIQLCVKLWGHMPWILPQRDLPSVSEAAEAAEVQWTCGVALGMPHNLSIPIEKKTQNDGRYAMKTGFIQIMEGPPDAVGWSQGVQ